MLPGETDKEHSGRVITALLRIDPTDELEYMIATQLVGLHNLAIQTMGHAAGSTKVAKRLSENALLCKLFGISIKQYSQVSVDSDIRYMAVLVLL